MRTCAGRSARRSRSTAAAAQRPQLSNGARAGRASGCVCVRARECACERVCVCARDSVCRRWEGHTVVSKEDEPIGEANAAQPARVIVNAPRLFCSSFPHLSSGVRRCTARVGFARCWQRTKGEEKWNAGGTVSRLHRDPTPYSSSNMEHANGGAVRPGPTGSKMHGVRR